MEVQLEALEKVLTQQSVAPTLLITAAPVPLKFGNYQMGVWEAVRGLAYGFSLTIHVGSGKTTIPNVALYPRVPYYANTPQPVLSNALDTVQIPLVTSIAPVTHTLTLYPIFPGVAQLSIRANTPGGPVNLISLGGLVSEAAWWFYVVDRELVTLAVKALQT